MTDYTQLVDKIVKIPQLAEVLIPDSSLLDLVSADWNERLVNNALYKEYIADSKKMFRVPTVAKTAVYRFQKIQSPDNYFKVRVVAKCILPDPYKNDSTSAWKPPFTILLQHSTPLKMIVEAMSKDLASEYHFDDISKVYLDDCNYLSCCDCNEYLQKFRDNGHIVPRENQTCIRDTQVFDGKRVMNRFGTQMKEIFKGPFIGIVDLELNGRYFYKNKNEEAEKTVRSAGRVLNMVAFKEEMLDTPKRTVFVGDLPPVHEQTDDNTMSDMFSVVGKPSVSGQKRPHEDEEDKEEDFLGGIPANYSDAKKCSFDLDDMEDTQAFP